MVISPMSSDHDVKILCESGTQLIATNHLLPGWVCAGDPKGQPCRTYNGIAALYCKHCKRHRSATTSELLEFSKALQNG